MRTEKKERRSSGGGQRSPIPVQRSALVHPRDGAEKKKEKKKGETGVHLLLAGGLKASMSQSPVIRRELSHLGSHRQPHRQPANSRNVGGRKKRKGPLEKANCPNSPARRDPHPASCVGLKKKKKKKRGGGGERKPHVKVTFLWNSCRMQTCPTRNPIKSRSIEDSPQSGEEEGHFDCHGAPKHLWQVFSGASRRGEERGAEAGASRRAAASKHSPRLRIYLNAIAKKMVRQRTDSGKAHYHSSIGVLKATGPISRPFSLFISTAMGLLGAPCSQALTVVRSAKKKKKKKKPKKEVGNKIRVRFLFSNSFQGGSAPQLRP